MMKQRTIMDMLLKRYDERVALLEADAAITFSDAACVTDRKKYLKEIMTAIDANQIAIAFQPVIFATNRSRTLVTEYKADRRGSNLSAADVFGIVSSPDVFVWLPDKIFPDLKIPCNFCGKHFASKEWCKPREVVGLTKTYIYLTVKYRCRRCSGVKRRETIASDNRDMQTRRICKDTKVSADDPSFLQRLPSHVKSCWSFHTRGKLLCDIAVLDLVRALATRSSWSAIADTLNEMHEAEWNRSVLYNYKSICDTLDIRISSAAASTRSTKIISAQWIRNLYMTDASVRKVSAMQELSNQLGDDILVLDWTVDAATKCQSKYLLNAMDGQRHILLSVLMDSCHPFQAAEHLKTLAHRGVSPRVVYVDSECCGAWRTVVARFWKDAIVCLDVLHAMRRLSQTVVSTQHPSHLAFCHALSDAFFSYDNAIMKRLRAAQVRECNSFSMSVQLKKKYVPRIITDPARICRAIERVLQDFRIPHKDAGCLLTDLTGEAWRNLKIHVEAGCLCDPEGVDLNIAGDADMIGGEEFVSYRSRRGTSALEGFHTHQKLWLGTLATHSKNAGSALLTDGAVRWNRKRKNNRSS